MGELIDYRKRLVAHAISEAEVVVPGEFYCVKAYGLETKRPVASIVTKDQKEVGLFMTAHSGQRLVCYRLRQQEWTQLLNIEKAVNNGNH